MPIIQIAENQNSFLRIMLNMAYIVYILVKFTVQSVHIDSYGVKIVIGQFHNGLGLITVFDQPD
jgi:hypothetical protein